MKKEKKLFTKKNFIEREAEEESEKYNIKTNKKRNINKNQKEKIEEIEDSYGISTKDEEEEVIGKQKLNNRIIFNNNKLNSKRKRNPVNYKKDNKKRTLQQIKKRQKNTKNVLSNINWNYELFFRRKNIDIDINKNEVSKYNEEDEEINSLKLSYERKIMSNLIKNNNSDFVERIKQNNDFIKKNTIILNNDSKKRSKSLKNNNSKEKKNIHRKLKLHNFKDGLLYNKKKS